VGLKVIKSFGQERRELQATRGVLDSLWRTYIDYSVTSSLSANLVYFVSMIGPITVLCIGIYLVATQSMTLGALIAFFWLTFYLFIPIQSLSKARVQIQASMASVDRVFEYLDEPLTAVEAPNPISLAEVKGAVELKDVVFSYEPVGFALQMLNLKIAAGEKIAIVGHSGSGKSTIVGLILRLYDPIDGSVSLDGVDLRNLANQTLRDNIAVVDQDPLLFHATIGENIAYGKPDALFGEIESAARVANIYDFIASLPNGFDTLVGERGVTLSGGEKQRICLARAVIKDPKILLLDEATSALDTISEKLIQDALDTILVNKTAVIVAHRLSTVKKADRIITMQNGRIIDQGTHSDLLGRSQVYRDLAEHQLA
jgi:subfamily B ATP-binding cassette protein MsbA